MDITFSCGWCGQQIVIDAAGVGLTIECPKCGQSLTVPAQADLQPEPATTKQCPFCAETIKAEAVVCRYCGRDLAKRVTEAVATNTQGSTESDTPSIPSWRVCPHCGANAVGRARGLHGVGEMLLCLVFFLACILPGFIYYAYIESVPYCPA